MEMSLGHRANTLAEAGDQGEGLRFLRQAQSRGEPDGFFVEGLWQLEGRFVPRDLPGARTSLAKAAEEGHVDAARIFAGLIARGVGASADWPAALALLEQWSTRDSIAARQLELITKMNPVSGNAKKDFVPIERSQSPRIVRVDQFLSADECAFLIELAEPRMKRSMVFSQALQTFIEDPVRTSDLAAFPVIFEWPFVHAINRRIARATQTAVECGEPLQVLRYRKSQEYRPHCDAVGIENPRVLTAVVWLNEDFEGGETCFDQLGLTERPRTGDLLYFANTLPDGSSDLRTRHAGTPVISGTKYLASRWIRARPWQEHGFGVRGMTF